MCGICGFTGRPNEPVLKKMTDSLFHRGPDEDGFYSDGKVNLGIRRLSIIDIATGHQPIHNEDKGIWAVFNGEIYNFQELRRDLEEKGHRFYTSHSDTEVIVHLYEEYGNDFAHKMNGMFTIALWDKNNDKLMLVRDRMGVKPLFYAQLNNNLVFGSEIKAILSYPDYTPDINYEGIYHYFTFKNVPAPLTAFKGIYSLLPGEMLIFSNKNIFKERWWKLNFDESEDYTEEYIKERIFALLEDSTRLRMVSDVTVGAYLSGGIDSSSVVALMTRFTDKPVKTFSLGYVDELKNKEADLHYARKVSKLYKTEHYEYIMSHDELIENIEDVIGAFDQPFSGTISTYFLSKLIKNHVKVALSGDGSDELFGSYLSHRVAQPIYHFARLYNAVNSNKMAGEEERLFAPFEKRFLKDLFEKSKGDEAVWRYNLCLFSDEEKESLLTNGFKSVANKPSSFLLMKHNFDTLTAKEPLNRILEMEWNTQLPDQVLSFVDALSMAHSVEIRSPFLDYRLVEFAATVKGNLKIKNGSVKDILKNSLKTLLSEDIIKRPKEGFVLPVFDWMVEKLKDFCLDVLSEKRLRRHGFLNTDAVKDMLGKYYSGDRGSAARVWNLMMFQIWWERYFG
ncbi:MAG: asparagine synthase (glutamine-hydrolyzing) [Nitrospirota bacterium]